MEFFFHSSDPQMNKEQEGIRLPSRLEWTIKILVAALVIAIGVSLIAFSQNQHFHNLTWGTPLAQVGLALVITGLTFILINQQLEKGNREYINSVISGSEEHIRKLLQDVTASLSDLKKHNQILRGAIDRGVEQIYARRSDGLRDLMEDMLQSKHIRMLGISLREYFVSSGHHYRDMEALLDGVVNSTDKTIKVLIINPYSSQATIRAERESDKDFDDRNRYEDSGLYSDVWQSMRYLDNWENRGNQKPKRPDVWSNCNANCAPITARVYNCAPTCFLVITDSHTYIEQYHYGVQKSGLVGGNFPLLRFPSLIPESRDKADIRATTSVAEQLLGHFEYVWNQRGTSTLPHLMKGRNIGVSKSAWECKLANLFSSRYWAEDRIKYLLAYELNEIMLIGISLRDFFHAGKGLYTSIQEASTRVPVKALILDPLSEQGRFRSEREEPNIDPSGGSSGNNLFYEVNTSIRSVERLSTETPDSKVEARLYRASTNCFAIVTSESVIVEQYHYGSAAPGATILGGKVAVLEYSNGSAMYAEMKGHFEHIWDKLSVSVKDWRQAHPDFHP